MTGSTISVVIPVRNGRDYLAEAVASAADQRPAPDQILVVDDRSDDDSVDVARAVGAEVVHSTSPGPAAARNTGVRYSTSSLVAFLDADDRMRPGRLAHQATALQDDPGLDGALGQIRTFTLTSVDGAADGRPESRRGPSEGIEVHGPVSAGWLPSTLTVQRAAFLTTGGFNEELAAGEFIEWMSRCRAAGRRFAMLDVLVADRRAHSANITRDHDLLRRGYLQVARLGIARHEAGGASK